MCVVTLQLYDGRALELGPSLGNVKLCEVPLPGVPAGW